MKRILFTLGAGLCTFAGVVLAVGPPTNSAASARVETSAEAPAAAAPLDATLGQPTTPTTAALPSPAPVVADVPEVPAGYGCAAALAYLATHAKPGTTSYCPHYAEGHPAETWLTLTNGVAATSIYIATPCLQAYQNEASNSWGHWDDTATWIGDYPDDPYGTC